MATAPAYAANPRSLDIAQVSAANTTRDGTGTIVTVATGSAAGFRIAEVATQAIVTTTAGMVRLYLSTDTGSTWRLFDEIPVSAVTVAASTPAYRASRRYDNLVLFGTSDLLGASTHNAEAINVFPMGADL